MSANPVLTTRPHTARDSSRLCFRRKPDVVDPPIDLEADLGGGAPSLPLPQAPAVMPTMGWKTSELAHPETTTIRWLDALVQGVQVGRSSHPDISVTNLDLIVVIVHKKCLEDVLLIV